MNDSESYMCGGKPDPMHKRLGTGQGFEAKDSTPRPSFTPPPSIDNNAASQSIGDKSTAGSMAD